MPKEQLHRPCCLPWNSRKTGWNDRSDFLTKKCTKFRLVCHLPYGPTCYFNLSHVVMRHDIEDCEKMSEAFPHLIFHGFTTKVGERVTNILKYLFPVPKKESKRIMTFANTDDLISYRFVKFVFPIKKWFSGTMFTERTRMERLSWRKLAHEWNWKCSWFAKERWTRKKHRM